MKFLEFSPDSEPDQMFDRIIEEFIPDIFSALRNNSKFEVNRDEPLSPDEIVALYIQINKALGMANNFCRIKYGRKAPHIKMEMRIRDGSFVWFRFVPLDEAREPIMREKENISLVLPNDLDQVSALNKEGYNIIMLFSKFFPPKK